jgi:hypothetical protein
LGQFAIEHERTNRPRDPSFTFFILENRCENFSFSTLKSSASIFIFLDFRFSGDTYAAYATEESTEIFLSNFRFFGVEIFEKSRKTGRSNMESESSSRRLTSFTSFHSISGLPASYFTMHLLSNTDAR